MQSLITWNQLGSYTIIFLIFYYAAVLAVCYRQEVLKLASRFKRFDEDLSNDTIDNSSFTNQDQQVQLYDRVHDLMQDCKAVFRNVTNAPVNKDKLIEELQHRVKSYPEIKGTAFQISLTNHFEQESDHTLGIVLSDRELEKIWT
jgi:hypothetical protein